MAQCLGRDWWQVVSLRKTWNRSRGGQKEDHIQAESSGETSLQPSSTERDLIRKV